MSEATALLAQPTTDPVVAEVRVLLGQHHALWARFNQIGAALTPASTLEQMEAAYSAREDILVQRAALEARLRRVLAFRATGRAQ